MSLQVVKGTLPPFEQVADLMEYLRDDLEELAKRKGGIGQLMFDKLCKLYKVMPPKQVFTLVQTT